MNLELKSRDRLKDEHGRVHEVEVYIDIMVDWIDSKINLDGKRVLDVGTDYGYVLRSCLTKGADKSSIGLEPFLNSNPFSLDIRNAQFEVFEDEKLFDLIIFNHSLEHIEFPHGALRKAKTLLKEGGYIFLGLPHSGYDWAYETETHLSIWDERFARLSLERTGFNSVQTELRCFRNTNVELWAIAKS